MSHISFDMFLWNACVTLVLLLLAAELAEKFFLRRWKQRVVFYLDGKPVRETDWLYFKNPAVAGRDVWEVKPCGVFCGKDGSVNDGYWLWVRTDENQLHLVPSWSLSRRPF